MAGVLVYIEREGNGPRSGASAAPSADPMTASLEALGEGRRIATELGAPLIAFAPFWGPDHAPVIAGLLARAGADQILTAPSGREAVRPDWQRLGVPMCSAVNQHSARLVLGADTPTSRGLFPRVAARLRAAFAPRASVERGPQGELVFTRPLYASTVLRRLAANDIDVPVVATLCPGAYTPAFGRSNGAHLSELRALPQAKFGPDAPTASPADGALETAAVVVAGGGGLDADSWDLVRALAEALGGEYGATAALCRRGIAPASREIGLGGRFVSPRMYIACGASGSDEHLAGVAPDAEIVAINRDPEAPIFRVASYGLVANAADALPGLIDEAQGRSEPAVTP